MPTKPKRAKADSAACTLCDKAIEPGQHVMQEEIGYARIRREGGTNALALRRVTGRFAHQVCVEAVSRGISPHQESLL